MKILLVDDIENIRMLYKTILSSQDVDFFEAENGLEAYKICDKENIDLIISDFDMPDYNGEWLDERLFKEGKKIPILLVTAKYNDIFKDMFKRNLVALLYKPFSLEKLVSEVEKIKNKKNG